MFIVASVFLIILSPFMGATEEHIALLPELAVVSRGRTINISPRCG